VYCESQVQVAAKFSTELNINYFPFTSGSQCVFFL
jgi:hypothetical protein